MPRIADVLLHSSETTLWADTVERVPSGETHQKFLASQARFCNADAGGSHFLRSDGSIERTPTRFVAVISVRRRSR